MTTESNPESIDAAGLCRLRELGFNRISFGMQSVVPHVLATLDRTHSPGQIPARCCGGESSRVRQHEPRPDLWNAGESLDDWLASIDAALAASTSTSARTR